MAAAALVNLVGNRWVERFATVTAAIKIVGIAVLPVAGTLAAGRPSMSRLFTAAGRTPPDQ